VIDSGKGALALIARITDAATKTGIRGVNVTFTPQNGSLNPSAAKAEIALVKTTADKGTFRVKSLKPGTYMAIITKPGYKEQSVTVTVAHGDMTELIAELEKN
jgi:hypothetical protein